MGPHNPRDSGRRSDRGDRTAGADPDLEDLSEELAATLRDLRQEMDAPRGPFGLPRPPTPREVLRFTESYAIPTAIAVLEANIRALELLAAVLRAIDGPASDAALARDRAESVSRATLDRLDDALDDLQHAIRGRPENPEARRLLEHARDLRAEIEDRLGVTPDGPDRSSAGDARSSGEGGPTEDTSEGEPTSDVHEVPVDVEGELESIKRDVDDSDHGTGRDGGNPDVGGADTEGSDGERGGSG